VSRRQVTRFKPSVYALSQRISDLSEVILPNSLFLAFSLSFVWRIENYSLILHADSKLKEMSKEYDIVNDEPQMANEPTAAYKM